MGARPRRWGWRSRVCARHGAEEAGVSARLAEAPRAEGGRHIAEPPQPLWGVWCAKPGALHEAARVLHKRRRGSRREASPLRCRRCRQLAAARFYHNRHLKQLVLTRHNAEAIDTNLPPRNRSGARLFHAPDLLHMPHAYVMLATL